jgi:hypothetical protein
MIDRRVALLLAAGMLVTSIASAETYYVDARTGRDTNPGLSPSRAWQSLEKVNATRFQPGDRVLFAAGGSWAGQLRLTGSGTEGHPIVVDAYGTGSRPRIEGNGAEAAVLLVNEEYWEICGLDISNDAPAEGLRRGVLVRAEGLGRTLRHIYLRRLDVHHVRGKLGTGMAEKATGGIGFEVLGTSAPTRFDDIVVEECTIHSLDNTGLYIWSESAPHPRGPRWSEWRHTNVRIRKNRLSDIGKNAMAVRASLAPVIEYNIVERAAARLHGNAIYVFGCKDAVMQFNEVSGTRFDRLEGAAFDSDYNSEGTIIQYNYSHDNGGGLVNLCNNPASKPPRGYNDGTIVRYNISQNEIERVIAFDGPVTHTQVYNNTIFIGPGRSPRIVEFDVFGSSLEYASAVRFWNNIIYNAGGGTYAWGGAKEVVFEYNAFFGQHHPTEPPDPFRLDGDPMLAAPGSGGVGLESTGGYRLLPESPCVDSGTVVEGHGGRDFWGTPLYSSRPDRGACELVRPNVRRH